MSWLITPAVVVHGHYDADHCGVRIVIQVYSPEKYFAGSRDMSNFVDGWIAQPPHLGDRLSLCDLRAAETLASKFVRVMELQQITVTHGASYYRLHVVLDPLNTLPSALVTRPLYLFR